MKLEDLYEIEELKNDFNYFDIRAKYKDENGTEKVGKFRYEELEDSSLKVFLPWFF